MDLKALRAERQKWLLGKDIISTREELSKLPAHQNHFAFGDDLLISSSVDMKQVERIAKQLKPWRKGGFRINELFIDSEWRSHIKYDLIAPHLNIADKVVGDIGCNNGYYMFRLLEQNPAKLIGFDPSALNFTQFEFINAFVQSDITFELLGIEHLPFYETKFDVLLMLGVLYHRSDPIGALKNLYAGLKPGGEAIIDTFYIDGEDEMALSPANTYAKIPNVYFVPTINTLLGWIKRAKFDEATIIATAKTDENEQRKTAWIDSQSLNDFLDPNDSSKTIEGYTAPQRVYVKIKKR